MALAGADRLDRALARVEEDATDRNTLLAAAELILATARPAARSTRVRATGKASASRGRGGVRFGSDAVPWTAPSHFGHGSASSPRAQGGWMVANEFLFWARDQREDDVFDLLLTRTTKAIRDAGL